VGILGTELETTIGAGHSARPHKETTKMDITKVTAAINKVHEELNTVTDAEVKAKVYKGLNRLNLAASALKLAETHLAKAVTQTTPKAKEPAAKSKK
jgi:acetylornithine deacetylase/succinyl-diaminopimelate desuccinylase-like protein